MIDWEGKKTMFVTFRHAEKIVGEDYTNEAPSYPMITKRGEAQTREMAKEFFKNIEDAPEGTVVVFCGCSKAVRTRSTLAVLADEVRRLCWGKEFITFSLPRNEESELLKTFSRAITNLPTKVIIEHHIVSMGFVASPGQDDAQIAMGMAGGLKGMETIFRLFFPDRYLILISVGHSREIELCMKFLGGLMGEENDARAALKSAHFRFIMT